MMRTAIFAAAALAIGTLVSCTEVVNNITTGDTSLTANQSNDQDQGVDVDQDTDADQDTDVDQNQDNSGSPTRDESGNMDNAGPKNGGGDVGAGDKGQGSRDDDGNMNEKGETPPGDSGPEDSTPDQVVDACGGTLEMQLVEEDIGANDLILPGDVISGMISPVGDTDTYTFRGSRDDQITVYLNNRLANGSLGLELSNPDGQVINSAFASRNDREFSTILAADGLYTVFVDAPGDEVGNYSLVLNQSFPTCSTAEAGDTLELEIEDEGDRDSFSFDGSLREWWAVHLRNRTPDAQLGMTILNPDGASYASAFASRSDRDLTVVMDTDGPQTVVIDAAGDGIGPYDVTLSRLHPAELDIARGESVQADLFPEGRVHSYEVCGNIGETLSVFLQNRTVSGSLGLLVIDPDGVGVASAFPSQNDRQLDVALVTDGCYSIVVDGTGDSSGPYTLTVN